MSLEQTTERRAKWFWMGLILVLLISQIGIGVAAVVLANSDASSSILPNYHQRALAWDQFATLRRDSQALGWRAEFSCKPASNAAPTQQFTVAVCTPAGDPVLGATGEVRLYHHRRASQVDVLPLTELNEGLYQVMLPNLRPGLWQVELHLRGPQGERFLQEQTVEFDDQLLLKGGS